jgi:hypothetical protein
MSDLFYGTVTGFRTYHAARNNLVPGTATDDVVTAALLVASEWMDARYLDVFGGTKMGMRDQVREWPRSGVVDHYGYAVSSLAVPREIENATYEIALKQISKPGVLAIDLAPGKYKAVAISGAVSVTYNQFNSAADLQIQFAIVDQIVSSLIGCTSTVVSPYSGDALRA